MSKGSRIRPSSVSKAEYDANFEAAFGHEKRGEDVEPGYPPAFILSRKPNPSYPGIDLAKVKCPLCGKTHTHGVKSNHRGEHGHRVAHCHKSPGYILTDKEKPEPFWTGPGYRGEYQCPHGLGHGNHIHGCDRCCWRDDFPLNEKNIEATRKHEEEEQGNASK